MKKILSIILAFAMVISIFPASIAFAADGDITYDFIASAAKAIAAGEAFTNGKSNQYFEQAGSNLASYMPAGITVNSVMGVPYSNLGIHFWQENIGLFISNSERGWTDPVYNWQRNRLAFDIEISEAKAGWYRPSVKINGILASHQYSVYVISGSDVKYLGELTSTSNGAALNPVELSAGTHTLLLGVHADPVTNDARGNLHTYIESIKLTKLDEAPAMSTFSANIPTTVAHNATADITVESATMSDGGAYSFAEYAAAATGGCTGLDTTSTDNYILVESSDTTVATVKRVSANEWTLTPVKEGETTITVTPYYGGVAQTDLKQTEIVSVTYPNAAITGNNVTIGLTAVVDGVVNDAAKALLAESDVVAGNVKSVKVGDTVSLKAADSETLKFLYWYNGNSGRMISDAATYTFTAGTNTPIFAKYADVNGELTEYFSTAGQLVEESEGEFGAEPTKTIGNYYKLFKSTAAGVASTLVNKISEAANFVCWKKNNEIVSYNKNYSFYTWADAVDAEEETEGEESDVPAVVLFSNGKSHMLELVNFEGVEIIEKGILFGGDLTISHCEEKAVALEDKNQFTASSDEETARAYVIYRDGATIRVAYSD